MRSICGALLLLLLSTTALAATPEPSPDRFFSAEIDSSAGATHAKIVVRRRGSSYPVARFDPNPGGGTRNLDARFVAADNVLASWSCGSPCDVAVLFSATGHQVAIVASAERFEVSPDRRRAVVFDETVGKPMSGGRAKIVDLQTGATLLSVSAPGVWNACEVQWQPQGATLLPCDARTAPISLQL